MEQQRKSSKRFLLKNVIRGNIVHNWPGAIQVMRLLTIHKMPAGLLGADHPWITGIVPGTEATIWGQNIVFQTPVEMQSSDADLPADTDETIVGKVGKFLATMVKKSTALPEIPHGPKRRMPHAINYLHGAVHYNGVSLLFNNFAEAKNHLADDRFREELLRMIEAEQREVTFVFRQRNYDPVEFAYFSCFVMSHLPWFANVNGAQKRVMWGNASPYPALNIINGAWLDSIEDLRFGHYGALCRPAIDKGLYFQGDYGVEARDYHYIERTHAYLINKWVRKRGFAAGLYFVDRKTIEPQRYEAYVAAGKDAAPVNEFIKRPKTPRFHPRQAFRKLRKKLRGIGT